ncbi:MAG TPA: MarR family transcriptional regulator [Acidimicrobiales bacterium]
MKETWRDDDVVSAWAAMLRLHARLVPLIDAELQRHAGMPLAWYDVLLELSAAADKKLRMFDLGEVVVLSRTRVSRVVDELVRAGYLEKVPNPDDGRSAFARLTPAGTNAFRRAAPTYLELIRNHFGGHFTAGDAKTLRRVLSKALAAGAADDST